MVLKEERIPREVVFRVTRETPPPPHRNYGANGAIIFPDLLGTCTTGYLRSCLIDLQIFL